MTGLLLLLLVRDAAVAVVGLLFGRYSLSEVPDVDAPIQRPAGRPRACICLPLKAFPADSDGPVDARITLPACPVHGDTQAPPAGADPHPPVGDEAPRPSVPGVADGRVGRPRHIEVRVDSRTVASITSTDFRITRTRAGLTLCAESWLPSLSVADNPVFPT